VTLTKITEGHAGPTLGIVSITSRIRNPAVNNDPAIGKFFQGTLTVTDYYSSR
jgi:hypothetical protein